MPENFNLNQYRYKKRTSRIIHVVNFHLFFVSSLLSEWRTKLCKAVLKYREHTTIYWCFHQLKLLGNMFRPECGDLQDILLHKKLKLHINLRLVKTYMSI